MITWDTVDTVLLDMDGTLLDLCYDNTLWSTLLPARFGAARGMSLGDARQHLFSHMGETRGQLQFYCLDYWATFTGLDIIALHHELAGLIAYRPNVPEFLTWLTGSGKRSLLVTNAHRDSLAVKHAHSGLAHRLDAVISSHDFGAPKESQVFWQQLMRAHPFDPARTLLIDDNDAVLDAAADYGIVHLLNIEQPDSGRPARQNLGRLALKDFRDITPTAPKVAVASP
ncbi:MAG: GMP/IMP nucleotidase [Pseudomonadales bacterium]|nr:GMP/IMP nucleotidase [Pseudomonadales bacterium]